MSAAIPVREDFSADKLRPLNPARRPVRDYAIGLSFAVSASVSANSIARRHGAISSILSQSPSRIYGARKER